MAGNRGGIRRALLLGIVVNLFGDRLLCDKVGFIIVVVVVVSIVVTIASTTPVIGVVGGGTPLGSGMALGSMGFLPSATMMAPAVGCTIDFLGFNAFSWRRGEDGVVELVFACDVLKL